MKVLDLSHYQKDIDFDLIVKNGVKGVILRCITKSMGKDVSFEKFYKLAKEKGLLVGAYTYSYDLNTTDAMARACATRQVIQGKDLELGFYLDLEWNKQRELTSRQLHLIILSYESILKNISIYCNLDWYKNVIRSDDKKTHSFWIARYPSTKEINLLYTPNADKKPNVENMIGWQYSNSCNVGGILCDVSLFDDTNIVNKQVDVHTSYTKELQSVLNSRYDLNLVVDGILGKNTYKSIIDNLK